MPTPQRDAECPEAGTSVHHHVRPSNAWQIPEGASDTTKSYIVAAASAFPAGVLVTAAHAQSTTKCHGINACEGQSDCSSYKTSRKGKNACKGQGMTVTSTTLKCIAQGGSALP